MVEKVLAIFSSWAIILSLKECIQYMPSKKFSWGFVKWEKQDYSILWIWWQNLYKNMHTFYKIQSNDLCVKLHIFYIILSLKKAQKIQQVINIGFFRQRKMIYSGRDIWGGRRNKKK